VAIYLNLHERLIARQSKRELQRKRDKARRKAIWTQEDVDAAYRWADDYLDFLEGDHKPLGHHLNTSF
jgi:hypothetical protein